MNKCPSTTRTDAQDCGVCLAGALSSAHLMISHSLVHKLGVNKYKVFPSKCRPPVKHS